MAIAVSHVTEQDATTNNKPTADTFFLQAVQEDSNLEMDWLWLATKVRTTAQRRYALLRALRINPRSAYAKRGLARLSRYPDRPVNLS